jgi:hypothetical protein
MLWTSELTATRRSQLFATLPLTNGRRYVVDRYGQYRHDVRSLPPHARKIIWDAAGYVIESLLSSWPVVAILLRGHADQDLLKTGEARLKFEKEISEQRAQEVKDEFDDALTTMSWRLASDPDARSLDSIAWQVEGVGATMLVVRPRSHPPLTEAERSLNRRVEIFLAQSYIPHPPSIYPETVAFVTFEPPSIYPNSVEFDYGPPVKGAGRGGG